MKLINFIKKLDNIESEMDVNLYIDNWINYKAFIDHDGVYDLVFSGKLEDIPIMYGDCYMVDYETYIDWDNHTLEIYARDRKGK